MSDNLDMLRALKAFVSAGEDVVKAGGGAPAKWDYSALTGAWQTARDIIAAADGGKAVDPRRIVT